MIPNDCFHTENYMKTPIHTNTYTSLLYDLQETDSKHTKLCETDGVSIHFQQYNIPTSVIRTGPALHPSFHPHVPKMYMYH